MTVDNERIQAPALEGEDISTSRWEDAQYWVSVYADLLSFKHRLLDRVRSELLNFSPQVQEAAKKDLRIIEDQMEGYQARLDLWYKRIWELHGLYVDADKQVVFYYGREAKLTNRELQLLQFLLDHPHRFYTADQIMERAWAEAALVPADIRHYVSRTRKILKRLGMPCDLVNRHGHGYGLTFATDTQRRGAGTSAAV